jgi:hypothetical protein
MCGSMPSARSVSSGRGHNAAHQSRSGMLVAGNMAGSAFATYESVPKDFELACIRFALGTAERIDRRPDPHVNEAAVLDHLLPGCTRQTTSNSGRPKIDVGHRRCRHRLAIGDIRELQMTAGL